MQLWRYRKANAEVTRLDEFIRWTNNYLTKLQGVLEQHHSAFRGVGTFSNGTAQPSVFGAKVWLEKNTAPTTIVHFRDGEEGQDFFLVATGANTTVANTATVRTKTGANVVMNANSVMHFVTADGTNWREV